jgi:hypothetical protein
MREGILGRKRKKKEKIYLKFVHNKKSRKSFIALNVKKILK